ncbi:MAG: aspartate kinase [Bdellovibrionales bacterium]|nr:aspartate kinase [Bdellovibrionales bacterium]
MNLFIKKFGGTSVGSIDRIMAVADRIYECHQSGEKMVIVLSAMSGETNRLVQMAQEINPAYKGMAYDMLLASGEQVSISLLSIALNKKGLSAVPLLAYQVGIQTDSLFSSARIQNINTDLILKLIKQNKIPLIAGFQGINKDNQITTLGRGGSDITAVALSAALKQSTCEIYTDVPNIYTADPRLVKTARKITQLSFEEMMEMAILGTKVLHFRCVELAAKFNIKVHLRSTFEKTSGTWVLPKEEIMESPIVSSVISDMNTCIIKLFPIPAGVEFISNVFNKLSEKSIIVDVISQSYNSEGQRLAFSIKEEQLSSALEILSPLLGQDKITVIKDVAKVSIVGVGMANQSGVAAQFFETIKNSSAHLHLITTSDIKISAIVDKNNSLPLMKGLHKTFNLE